MSNPRKRVNAKMRENMNRRFTDLPRECWMISGALSNGSPFFSRDFNEKVANFRAARMNRAGASVTVEHQVRGENPWVWEKASA